MTMVTSLPTYLRPIVSYAPPIFIENNGAGSVSGVLVVDAAGDIFIYTGAEFQSFAGSGDSGSRVWNKLLRNQFPFYFFLYLKK